MLRLTRRAFHLSQRINNLFFNGRFITDVQLERERRDQAFYQEVLRRHDSWDYTRQQTQL